MQPRERLTSNTVFASQGMPKTAAKKDSDPGSLKRDLKGAPPYDTANIAYISNMIGYLCSALELVRKSLDEFTSINSDAVSPDGMLGGKGHVMGVRDVKSNMADMVVDLSNLLDTLSDELNNPGWGLDEAKRAQILEVKKKAESDIESLISTISQASKEDSTEPAAEDDTLADIEAPDTETIPADEPPAPAEDIPAEEAPPVDDGTGEPAFPEMGELDETPDEGTVGMPKMASSNKLFIGSNENMDSVARILARPVLAGLIKTADTKCGSIK